MKISALRSKTQNKRINQGDIFKNIEIIENIYIDTNIDKKKSDLCVKKITFPFIICLNQDCDLNSDFLVETDKLKDARLLHLAIAPVFIFEQFKSGKHWGDIFNLTESIPSKKVDFIKNNEIPRYHYLKFPDKNIPEFVIDFKHFFTINRDLLYNQIENRVYSLEALFKEKISQRFSNYISRIGLPEYEE